MARKVRARQKTPEQVAADRRAQAFAAVNLDPAASTLPANTDIDAERAERATKGSRGNLERARRMDAFEALKEGMKTGAYDAARRLEKDIAVMLGESDRGRSLMRIDCEVQTDRTDAQVAARGRVDEVMARIGHRDALLLCELISPSAATRAGATSWRGIVAFVTGEANAHAQAAVVRAACANLAAVYNKMLRAA